MGEREEERKGLRENGREEVKEEEREGLRENGREEGRKGEGREGGRERGGRERDGGRKGGRYVCTYSIDMYVGA